MALPTTVDSTTPAGSASPSLGDDQIRAFKLAFLDILGIPDATSITAAAFDIDADGVNEVIFKDGAAGATAAGRVRRNGSTLTYHDGTAARVLDMIAVAQTISAVKTFTAAPVIAVEDARTNTVLRPFTVRATTSGTPAASIGSGTLWQAESGDESPSDFGALDFVATDVTAGSEDTVASILLRVGGRALDEKYRFASTAGDGFTAIFTHANTADRTYTFPDADTTLGAGESGTWSDVTGSRAVDTIYQNTSGKKRRVKVTVQFANGAVSLADTQVGSASPPTIVISEGWGNNTTAGVTVRQTDSFEVPNNWYYRIATDTGSIILISWAELDE